MCDEFEVVDYEEISGIPVAEAIACIVHKSDFGKS